MSFQLRWSGSEVVVMPERGKKERLLGFLEERRIVSFSELVELLGNKDTAKHYVMELRRAGVLKYRDVIRAGDKRVVVYFVSPRGLEQYKEELRQKKLRKAMILNSHRRPV